MNYRELTKRLQRLGCYMTRQAAGSHEIWRNPNTQRQAVIPNPGSKEIPRGTLRAILRELGIDPAEQNR
ncbi:MAG TPA: type II toxin-antitoxin system HicA family toxin [Anaerolineae bacterium]|nr:type II toxin-antitoxin system HicA family toxin [Anaerolineae bacterium]